MTARHVCPVLWCTWFHTAVASPEVSDPDVDVPPWCTPTWVVASCGYGAPLTDAQVIAAHVATHPRAEWSGRMPSRAQVETARILITATTVGGVDA